MTNPTEQAFKRELSELVEQFLESGLSPAGVIRAMQVKSEHVALTNGAHDRQQEEHRTDLPATVDLPGPVDRMLEQPLQFHR